VLQLIVGVTVLGEHVSARLWVGFGIVWVALVMLTVDSLRAAHTNRRAAGAAEPVDAAEGDGRPYAVDVAEPCP
jgi:chloramphenicol-sensitive protein RarD